MPLEIVSVSCNTTLNPPEIVILLLGQQPFNVSTGVYELIRESLGLPENPCAGIGE